MGVGWIISSLITGIIVGAIARLLMPGQDRMGCLMTALLGIAGSFVGGFIGTLVWGGPTRYHLRTSGFLMSIVGSMVLLLLWRLIRRRD
jgi:uncharacterized membrane protein YeaQ/YmgE (transglycosylase-associated protein family)